MPPSRQRFSTLQLGQHHLAPHIIHVCRVSQPQWPVSSGRYELTRFGAARETLGDDLPVHLGALTISALDAFHTRMLTSTIIVTILIFSLVDHAAPEPASFDHARPATRLG